MGWYKVDGRPQQAEDNETGDRLLAPGQNPKSRLLLDGALQSRTAEIPIKPQLTLTPPAAPIPHAAGHLLVVAKGAYAPQERVQPGHQNPINMYARF